MERQSLMLAAASAWRACAWRVVGIDKSADFIEEAKRRAAEAKLAINFQVGDAEALPFADGAFDVARAERVLVYLPEPKRALEEMRRVTRPWWNHYPHRARLRHQRHKRRRPRIGAPHSRP